MNRHIHRISQMALAGAIALLVGCGSTPQQPKVPLPDPQTVPREQWSQALTVFDAMGLKGQRDIPKSMLGQGQSQQLGMSNVVGSAGDVFVGPSLGLGLGLFLLGGGGSPAEALPQIAVWVPADLVTSPEEAVSLAVSEWNKARNQVLNGNIRNIPVVTGKYPYGWNPSVAFASIQDSLLDKPIQISEGPHTGPSFINSKAVYGPIFIYPNSINIESHDIDKSAPELMEMLASNLPDWFYLYYPGSKFNKTPLPAGVFNGANTYRFVSQ